MSASFSNSSPSRKGTEYNKLSPAEKTMLGRFAIAFRDEKWKFEEILQFFFRAGYDVKERTLKRYVQCIEIQKPITSPVKKSGRPPALTESQKKIFIGWVLTKFYKHKEVHLHDGVAFLKDQWDIEVVPSTVKNIFDDSGLSSKKIQTHTRGIKIPDGGLVNMVIDWLKKMRVASNMKGLMCSNDATYTKHTTFSPKSYSPEGAGAPKSEKRFTDYTNTIITNVWSDGINRTPCVLFTCNPAFNTNGKQPKRNARKDEKIASVCHQYDVARKRIVYLDPQKYALKYYTGEKREYHDIFMKIYTEEMRDAKIIFSDNGNAYMAGDKTVFEAYGMKHVFYPAEVHQFLSPNDNKLHGVAKRIWRTSDIDHKDDVVSSIMLMHFIDNVPATVVSGWFKLNFCLGEGKVTKELAKKVVGGQPGRRQAFYASCARAFNQHNGNEYEDDVRAVQDDLDGAYWQLDEK